MVTSAEGYLFDYTSMGAANELSQALERTYSPGFQSPYSLQGRLVCVLKVATHALSIALKPIYYVNLYITTHLGLALVDCLPEEIVRQFPQALINMARVPELRARTTQISKTLLLSAPAAPISQIIQLFKAVMGILYPGFYFKEDKLAPYVRELAYVARQVGCMPELVTHLERGSGIFYKSCRAIPYKDYYLSLYEEKLRAICEKFRNPEITPEKKLQLLSMLNPEPKIPGQTSQDTGSGIEGCAPGLSRILDQICLHIDLPTDLSQVFPHLAEQCKEQVLDRMVFEVGESARETGWKKTLFELAHDPAHRRNALIVAIGSQIGLSESVIAEASHDPMIQRVSPLSSEEIASLVGRFRELYTQDALIKSLQDRINSEPNGSAGLKVFRDHMTRTIAESIPEAEIRGRYLDAFNKVEVEYYIRDAERVPGHPGYSDFNPDGILAFARTLGDNDPFRFFA